MARLFFMLASWPLGLLHVIGAFLGWLVYALSPSYRRRLRDNAQRAGITLAQRRESVGQAGKMVMESLRLWLRPAGQPIADAVHWHDAQLIDQALALGRGLIFLTPHLGSFETTAQAYAQRYGAHKPITVMYRPARYRVLRELEEAARARPALATAPAAIAGDSGLEIWTSIRDWLLPMLAVLPERALLCLTEPGFYYVDVAVLTGSGGYALQVLESQ